jgi:hypothetical protein
MSAEPRRHTRDCKFARNIFLTSQCMRMTHSGKNAHDLVFKEDGFDILPFRWCDRRRFGRLHFVRTVASARSSPSQLFYARAMAGPRKSEAATKGVGVRPATSPWTAIGSSLPRRTFKDGTLLGVFRQTYHE